MGRKKKTKLRKIIDKVFNGFLESLLTFILDWIFFLILLWILGVF
jgi:hypothetical protein